MILSVQSQHDSFPLYFFLLPFNFPIPGTILLLRIIRLRVKVSDLPDISNWKSVRKRRHDGHSSGRSEMCRLILLFIFVPTVNTKVFSWNHLSRWMLADQKRTLRAGQSLFHIRILASILLFVAVEGVGFLLTANSTLVSFPPSVSTRNPCVFFSCILFSCRQILFAQNLKATLNLQFV